MNPRTPWRREELALLESWSGTDASFQATLPGKPDQMSPTLAAVPPIIPDDIAEMLARVGH